MMEFAIAATAVMLLVFGILEFGRVMYLYHTVSNAARLGSRWAMVRGADCVSPLDHCNADSGDIQTWVQSQVPAAVDGNIFTVSAAWSTSTDPSGDCTETDPSGANLKGHVVCVTVSYPFHFALPFISTTTLSLSSTSRMIIAN
jgi:Flp pilus assembly protein TadG